MDLLPSVTGLRLSARKLCQRTDDRSGLALIATLLLLAMVAVLTTTALTGAMNALRTAGSDYQDTRIFYAAEAGAEGTLAQLKIALADGYLSPDELTNMKPPQFDGIDFDSFTVNKIGDETVETITDGPYAGLFALTQNVDIYSHASNAAGDISAVILRAKAQAIPIFQFGVFFEGDLEGTNGPPLHMAGRVHSNGNIYLSSSNAWYHEMVTTPNKVFHDRKDQHYVRNGVYIDDSGGNAVRLNFDSRSHPDPEAFKSESCSRFDCRLQTDAFDVDSLSLPLPDGVLPYELVRPREDSDTDAERNVKFAWNADFYLTIDLVNLSTEDVECGNVSVVPDPDVINSGNITLTGSGALCPGELVTFVASHPDLVCADFDFRALRTVEAGGKINSEPMDGCQFKVNLPDGAPTDIRITIELKMADYPQLSQDELADVLWLQDTIDANCTGGATLSNDPWPNMVVTRAGGESPDKADLCSIFQWEWSDFFDGRENELKDVLNVDLAALNAWVTGNAQRTIEILYVDFVEPGDIKNYKPLTKDLLPDATVDPALRLINGSSLPNRMTIANEWPLYIRGNLNSGNKQPAAVTGDGITIQSNAWLDANNRPPESVFTACKGIVSAGNACPKYTDWMPTWAMRTASETTVNAAFLGGHWATPCDHEDAGCGGGYYDFYGGGFHNFPRFVEDWLRTVKFHYTGALISPFTSQKTTGTWNLTYYEPPDRNWAFDTDFRDPRLLPPGTPNVGYVLRTAMREAY
jgi:hypothetical protein